MIGKLTFGSPTGYLEKGTDFNGLIHRQKQFLDYVNIVSILDNGSYGPNS